MSMRTNKPFNTLFLDRDGVLNFRLVGRYVRALEEFDILPGVLESLRILSGLFEHVVVVTNQQGIGKGLMTEAELEKVHTHFLEKVKSAGGRIDRIYHCPDLANTGSQCRKPETGMALQAQKDFPSIDFSRSYMVGDAFSDLEMGKRLDMTTVWIAPETTDLPAEKEELVDFQFPSLADWTQSILPAPLP